MENYLRIAVIDADPDYLGIEIPFTQGRSLALRKRAVVAESCRVKHALGRDNSVAECDFIWNRVRRRACPAADSGPAMATVGRIALDGASATCLCARRRG